MKPFSYQDGVLFCERTSVERLAEQIGTPFYLYSYKALIDRFNAFDEAFRKVRHLICFAVKANSSLAVLKALADRGAGADIVSAGELYRALKAGISPRRIVFAGVGKRADEIIDALKADILMFNVESLEELLLIDKLAGSCDGKARIAVRINPNIDPQTHPYISTGLRESKFGIDIQTADQIYRKAQELPHIDIAGVHMHIGSQITQVQPFIEALQKIRNLISKLNTAGIHVRYMDIGGGLGITYQDEKPPTPDEFALSLLPIIGDLEVELIVEPGRALVGKAGILVTKILYIKTSGKRNFMIVDAGMNDLIRPSLYGAYHEIRPVDSKAKGGSKEHFIVDIVGPVCETADLFAESREMPRLKSGDLLAIMDVGAYGFSMASNYNSRPRPAEVMVNGEEDFVIRERESYEDLIIKEHIPLFLKGCYEQRN